MVLVRVTRGRKVESEHVGAMAVAGPDGALLSGSDDAKRVVALRSSAKPFQLAAVVACGAADRFSFSPAELAVMAGSHAGTPDHVAAVRSALRKADIDESRLLCGIHVPFDAKAAEALLRAGERPSALHNNCSGKHVAMLAAAKHLGAPLDGYLDPEGPVQRLILAQVADASGMRAEDVPTATDGCSAPTYFLPLAAAARAFAALAADDAGVLARVRSAMTAHPSMVSGRGRLDTVLMEEAPEVCAKGGAEAFEGLAVRGPRGPVGIAIKILDGGGRAVGPAAIEALRQLLWAGGSVPARLKALHRPALLNHRGTEVGGVEATVALSA